MPARLNLMRVRINYLCYRKDLSTSRAENPCRGEQDRQESGGTRDYPAEGQGVRKVEQQKLRPLKSLY
jgi:hypothetical protein